MRTLNGLLAGHTVDGRVMQKQAIATRTGLLDALDEAMQSTPWRRLGVKQVANAAGVSPATFYQYFTELEDAVLELVRQRGEDLDPCVRRVLVLIAAEGYPKARWVLAEIEPSTSETPTAA